MTSISEIKQLKDYYEEKIEYLEYLIKHETYYCTDEKVYKQENYKIELKQLKECVSNIESELKPIKVKSPRSLSSTRSLSKSKSKKPRSRSLNSNRELSKSKSKKPRSRSLNSTLSEEIDKIRRDSKKTSKVKMNSKTKVKKSKSSRK